MTFDGLLGNDRLKENLRNSLQSGHFSHFYLISGPQGSGKRTLARLLAAAILCRGDQKPCLSCPACRKVLGGNHPDLITVEDPEHKAVAVKLVRQYREDMFVRPNESDYKIYLFPQELNMEGQNALLKIFEEPPKHCVFLLLTTSPEQMLPTVRSRCTELSLQPLSDKVLRSALQKEFPDLPEADLDAACQRSGGFLGQARALAQEGVALPPETEAFVKAYAAGDALALTETLVGMEKWKRDRLVPTLQQWLAILEGALACRAGAAAAGSAARDIAQRRNPKDLLRATANLQTAIEYALGNVSCAAICGWLAWELR